jgi:hypothetical protein
MVGKLRLDHLEFGNIYTQTRELALYHCHVFAQCDDRREERRAHC